MRISGLSLSWKRAIGQTQAKQNNARKTGIPNSKAGLKRKVGKMIYQINYQQITVHEPYGIIPIFSRFQPRACSTC